MENQQRARLAIEQDTVENPGTVLLEREGYGGGVGEGDEDSG